MNKMKVRDENQFKKVLQDLVKGMSISQVARKYGIAEITVYKYVQEAQDKGLLKREYNVDYIKKGKW
jgi:transposase